MLNTGKQACFAAHLTSRMPAVAPSQIGVLFCKSVGILSTRNFVQLYRPSRIREESYTKLLMPPPAEREREGKDEERDIQRQTDRQTDREGDRERERDRERDRER